MGCASDRDPTPTVPGPVSTSREEQGLTLPETPLSLTLVRFELRPPDDSEASTWTPGTQARLHVWLLNSGEAYRDYPSVVLESLSEGLHVEDGENVLYGLQTGHPTLLRWTLRAGESLGSGTPLSLRLRAFAHNSDWRAGRDPIGVAELSLELGQSFAGD